MEVTYKELLTRLKTEVPALRWIDLDRGQLEDPEGNYTFDSPAVFISFGTIGWGSIGERVEHGQAELSFRIAFKSYHDTNNHTPESVVGLAMTDLAIRKNVCAALHGFEGTNFNALQHTGTVQEPRDDGLLVFTETYQTMMRSTNNITKTEVDPVHLQITVGEQ